MNSEKSGSQLGRLSARNFDTVQKRDVDARQKLKEEMLQKLSDRRDNRPHLLGMDFKIKYAVSTRFSLICLCLGVFVTSASGDIQGIYDFREALRTILVNKHQELELSVELPSPYASLYEELTGEQIVLKNPHINDYNINRARSAGLEGAAVSMAGNFMSRNPVRRAINSVSRKMSLYDDEQSARVSRKKSKPKGTRTFRKTFSSVINRNFGSDKSGASKPKGPIIEIGELYQKFVTTPVSMAGMTRSTKAYSRNSRRRLPRRKLFSKAEELHIALKSLHEIGYVLWYEDNEMLRDIVFVDPQWVVNMIKTVIRHNMFREGEGSLRTIGKPSNMTMEGFTTAKNRFREEAILDSRLLFCFDLWKDASELDRFHMLSLMQNFDLLCEVPRRASIGKKQFLVNCFW